MTDTSELSADDTSRSGEQSAGMSLRPDQPSSPTPTPEINFLAEERRAQNAGPPVEQDRSLLAPTAAAAAAASVSTLLQTVAANRGSAVTRSGPSIEDAVRAELRPVLKQWLDAHLPGLVERLVRVEIERVVDRTLS